MKLDTIGWVALITLFVGGLNLGLIGLFKLDLITTIFGTTTLTKLVYISVGLSAVYTLMNVLKSEQ